ncbi:MAG: hypothetical protein J7K04_07055 [Spirochaetales bacterium]|nr:hypothetical protein [Spirochaetales bacterium]
MAQNSIIHIISHTHWDREWFLNSPFTNEWLLDFFDSLFLMFKKEPGYRFILDGQTLIVEDFIDELNKHGKNTQEYIEKIKKYVKEKRLFIGPYYLQPDWQLVSGESLVRNMLIGNSIASKYGAVMNKGWLLDNFGQISQTAQIHRGFGLEGIFVWRGVEMNPKNVKLEFIWESPDGSALTAVYLLDSYRNAMRLSEYPEILEERIINEIDKLRPFATTSNFLLMNGYDQEMVPDDIIPYIKKIDIKKTLIRQSTPEEYITAIEKSNPDLQKIKGYLYSGRFISVFPGILSSRMYLKMINSRCQSLIEKQAEPLSSLSWLMGNKYSDEFHSIWKLLLKNHPHDSICGVSIDDVHTDMELRFKKVIKLTKSIVTNSINKLANLIDTSSIINSKETFIIFNPLPSKRNEVITIKDESGLFKAVDEKGLSLPAQRGENNLLHILLDNIPAFGYRTIYLTSKDNSLKKQNIENEISSEDNWIAENSYYKIKVNDDGSVNILDKSNNFIYKNMGTFQDGGDAGDTYNFSPPAKDTVFSSSGLKATVQIIEKGSIKTVIKIQIKMNLPEQLADDRNTRSNKLRLLPITTFITIDTNSPLIKYRTLIKNTVKDHRLRILFPSMLKAKKSYTESPFDVVEHEIHPAHYNDDKMPDYLKRLLIGAREPEPITTFPQGSFVDLTDGKRGMAVINRGLTEYEIVGANNTIAVTLFRSIGWLARGDLLTRVGDAGPAIATPEAQCLREMDFNYAVNIHEGNWLDGNVHQNAEYFNTDCIIVKTNSHMGILSSNKGFLKISSSENAIKVTALKRSESGESLILRCYNPSNKNIRGILTSSFKIISAYYTDLKETEIKPVEKLDAEKTEFKAEPKKIVTLKIKLERGNEIQNNTTSLENQIINYDTLIYKEDFSNYTSIPVITQKDIKSEINRYKQIECYLKDANKEIESIEQDIDKFHSQELEKEKAKLQLAKAKAATLNRESLEARLSMILSIKKYTELNPNDKTYDLSAEEIERTLRKIGFELNKARIKKRTYDYIAEYYANHKD